MTEPTSRSPSVHVAYLDGIRGLAALYVVAHHASLQVWPLYRADQIPPPLRFLQYGRFGVGLFIVLSGYCLMLPVLRDGGRLRGGPWGFYRRRFWRIVPPFYAALALSLILIETLIGQRTGTHWDFSLPADGPSLLACLLLVQDVWMPYRINHAFWSIAVEWRIYFFFPLLIAGFRKIGPAPTTLLTLALSVGIVFGFRGLGLRWVADRAVIQYLALFGFGMFAATVTTADPLTRLGRVRDRTPWGILTLALAVGAVASCRGKSLLMLDTKILGYDLGVGLIWSMLLVFVATPRGGWLARVLSWRPIVASGVIGYSLYLIHAPLLQLTQQYIVNRWVVTDLSKFAGLIGVGVPIIFGSAAGFAYLFEPKRRRVVEVHSLDSLGLVNASGAIERDQRRPLPPASSGPPLSR